MQLRLFLFLSNFLSITFADVLWGCEPSCSPPASGSKPQIVNQLESDALPISIENLTRSLTSSEGKYGLLILESGSDFNTQWLLSSPTQSVGISGLISSKTPSTNFIRLSEGVYSIDPSLYVNSPKGIVIVSPETSLSYKTESPGKTDCELDGLLFAIIPWDETILSQLTRDISFIIPAQCPYCSTLLLSDKFIRICPTGEKRPTLPTRSPTEGSTASSGPVTVASSTTSTTTATSTKTEAATTSTAVVETSTSTIAPTTSTTIPPSTMSTIPTTTTMETTPTTTEPIIPTKPGDKKYRAVLRDDLKGIRLLYGDTTSPLGIIPCGEVLSDLARLGSGPKCNGNGKGVDASFGPGAVLSPGELITVLPDREVIPVEEPSSPISPSFLVEHKKVVMGCEDTVKFTIRQITGTGDRNATFQWSILGEEPISALLQEKAVNIREITLPTKMIKDNIILFVKVCNFVGKCTSSGSLTVTVANWTEALILDIEGIPEIIYPSMVVKLEAVPQFASCDGMIPAKEVLYNWTVNGSEFSGMPTYRIPSFQYSANDVIPIRLTTSYKDPKTEKMFTAEASTQLTYAAEPLILTIDAARRTHPADVALRIDASASRDPNSASSALKHSWSCQNLTSNRSCNLPTGLNYHSSIFELPGGVLEKGGEFLFTNDFTSSLGQNGTVSSRVKVSSPLLPSVTAVPLTYPKQSIREYIRLLVLVSSEETPMNVSWKVVKSEGYGFFQLTDFISGNNINFNIPSNGRKMLASLTIPPKEDPHWQGLSPDTRYLLRITATNPKGSSSADVELQTEEELPQGVVEVSPVTNLSALSSEITFRLGDGWNNLDYPISYRFGYRVLQVKNDSTIEWFPHSTVSSVDVILPSGGGTTPSCLKRIGFTGLIEACNRSGACRLAESAPFYIAAPKNISLAMDDVAMKINDDFVNGKHLDSIQKILAMQMELCANQIDSSVVDRTAQALLDSLSMESDLSEWKEVMLATTRVIPSVSEDILVSMLPLLEKYNQKMGLHDSTIRLKRDIVSMDNLTALMNTTDDPEELGSQMLQMYGLLLVRNQNVVDVYFYNLNVYLTIFCKKLDAENTRIMQAKGGDYTIIQAQTVNPNQLNFLNRTYEPAGDETPISIVDPISGGTATSYMGLAPLYTVQIPIDGYLPTNYYACYMYSDSGQVWDVASCTASSFATKIQGINYITCTCSNSGFIGVFTQAPPPPPAIYLHSEVRISFILNTTVLPSEGQMKIFKDNIAVSGQLNRLVDWETEKNNDSQVVVNVTLRPPFKTSQVTSAYALQSILRVVDPQSGFVAYDAIKILLSSYEMIQRDLVGDGNARKIIVRMLDKLYPQVVGNKSDSLTTTWINMMADALRISSYRFKNAGLFIGIFFNVTITKPFEEEKYPLSAEEIALMLVESTKYKEIQVVSASGEFINLPEILLTRDVVELRVVQQQNPLVTILIIAVSSGVLLASLYIGGAIVVKIRTDRCLEEERRRMVTVDPADLNAPPRYREAVQGSGVVRSRHR